MGSIERSTILSQIANEQLQSRRHELEGSAEIITVF